MKESRTKNTKRNIIASFGYTLLTMIFQFVSRSLIIKYLGEEYLGLSSLFTSILQVLNMAEMGFSGAIVYNMYKPIANNDVNSVCVLLAYYKKIYNIIGGIVLVAGIVVMPFVPKLIKGTYPGNINIYVLFALYLLNTSISYFLFAYKTSLLEAVQRMDLAKIAYSIVSVVQYTLQILALVKFHNYYLFIVFMIFGTACRNIVAAYLASKFYPQYSCKGFISTELKKDIISRVKGLLICNISGVTYTTFDSIILSAFVGLSAVARYNNYITIMQGVTTIIVLVRNAMQASVGNSIAAESVEKNYQDMILWQFLFSAISSWCVSCMISLYQPFMVLWMGSDRLLPFIDVTLICCWFNVSSVQHSFFLYLSGNGLWWELRWPYIGSTVSNLILNIMLGKSFGVTGIIFATLFSTTIFGLVWQCLVIFKYYFKKSAVEFFLHQCIYFLVSILISIITYYVNKLNHIAGLGGLVLSGIICTVISSVLLVLVYHRTVIYKKAKNLIINAIKA